MSETKMTALGTQPIGSLLIKQAVPASIGILVMSLNILVDTIFVGNWIGSVAIAAINVVLPVSFFVAALGMSIGIGGSSVLSRALGKQDMPKALHTFGNQITLTFVLITVLVAVCLFFADNIIPSFGGRGMIFEPAKIYYTVLLWGVLFLGFSMMGNTVIRAEGQPKFAMFAMMIPSVSNLVLDIVFYQVFKFGNVRRRLGNYGFLLSLFCLYFLVFHVEKLGLKGQMGSFKTETKYCQGNHFTRICYLV